MVKHCYEFEVQLMVNGEFLKNLQKVRIIGNNYNECENKLITNFQKVDNVKLIDKYFIDNYTVIE